MAENTQDVEVISAGVIVAVAAAAFAWSLGIMVAVWLLRRRGCGHHDGVMQVAVKPATGRRPMMLRHATRGLIMAQNVVDAFDAKLLTDLVDKHRRRAQRDLDKLQEAELAAFGDGSKKDQLRAKQKAQKLQMMQALDEMDSSLATLLDSDVDPDEDPELGPAGCGSGYGFEQAKQQFDDHVEEQEKTMGLKRGKSSKILQGKLEAKKHKRKMELRMQKLEAIISKHGQQMDSACATMIAEAHEDISATIRVDHLAVGADGADEQAVTAALTEFGQVHLVVMRTEGSVGTPGRPGWAFVSFTSPAAASAALSAGTVRIGQGSDACPISPSGIGQGDPGQIRGQQSTDPQIWDAPWKTKYMRDMKAVQQFKLARNKKMSTVRSVEDASAPEPEAAEANLRSP